MVHLSSSDDHFNLPWLQRGIETPSATGARADLESLLQTVQLEIGSRSSETGYIATHSEYSAGSCAAIPIFARSYDIEVAQIAPSKRNAQHLLTGTGTLRSTEPSASKRTISPEL